MTRIGKIARLPHLVRNQLNRRLQEGEPGTTLVGWLNGQPAVQSTLQEQFGGRPVTEQNLSEWKQGGYQDWLRHEESRQLVATLAEQQGELDAATDGAEISDRFASVLSVEFVALTRKLLEEKEDTGKKWECMREVLRELSQLRRDDHRGVRTAIERYRWEQEVDRDNTEMEKRQKKQLGDALYGPKWAQLQLLGLAKVCGDEASIEIAALMLEAQYNLLPGSLVREFAAASESSSVQSNPTESDPIRPNPAA